MRCALISFNCRYSHSCLSLFYLRNELERHAPAMEISLHQFTINDPYFATLQRIIGLKADVYFLSVYIWNAELVARIITDLATVRPETMIVLGGPQAAAMEQDRLPPKTTVVYGEIEAIDRRFYADLADATLAARYQSGRAGLFPSPYRPEDFRDHLANRAVYYESSRGCPFSCSYCISARESGIRTKDDEMVRQELLALLSHSPGTVRFVDRTFNASPSRSLAIWQFLLEQRPVGTLFHFEIAPDLFTEEMFALLQQVPAGLFQFEIGIQSTHPPTLSAINRKSDISASLAVIRRLAALDTIHLHVDLILGLPYETKESFSRSFNDVFAVGPHYIQMGLLKVLPHTPLRDQANEFGLVYRRTPPYEILATAWLPQAELAELFWFGECVEAFANNRYFRSFFACIRQRGENGFAFFMRLLSLCRQEDFFQRAKTQELLSSLLLSAITDHPHRHVLTELLLFDWLRSGHRFLPPHLNPNLLNAEKNRLWRTLPQDLPPCYQRATRNEFFKKAIFVRFSQETLQQLDLEGGEGILCFLPERERGVAGLVQTVRIA
ncbi:MAG: DUF4080 domain-containing protein [Thermodesulfobacteriota bacterium]